MKKRSTYTLLVQSEEQSRNIMEMVLCAGFGLSALLSIWQFVQQPSALPLDSVGTTAREHIEQRIAS